MYIVLAWLQLDLICDSIWALNKSLELSLTPSPGCLTFLKAFLGVGQEVAARARLLETRLIWHVLSVKHLTIIMS